MTAKIAKSRGTAFVAALSALLGVACSSGPTGGTDPAHASVSDGTVSKQGINGTPIYAKTLGPAHVIEFYEFGVGTTVIREVLSVDSGQTAFMATAGPVTSLSDIYTKLNATTEVPIAIVQADQRAKQVLADNQATKTASATSPAGRGGALGQEVLSAADGCSADVNGDGWSGQWFINTYCNAGGFRYCHQNFANEYWNDFSKSWVSWRQMEGDWNLPGHITLQECHCGIWACGCPNQTDVDHDVLPRNIEFWDWNPASNAFAYGTSQCGHSHIDLLWNN